MAGSKKYTWEETRLWEELRNRADEPGPTVCDTVEAILPGAETVLDAGDTGPTDFTLHDSQHGWRVAQRMADLAGPGLLAEMGPHDLALLLLSAYLHDIGMTPSVARLTAHLDFLQTGAELLLDDNEREDLQAWLDDEHDGLAPPIVDGKPSPADLRLVRQLTAEYVRHRHNDWSEDWIRQNLRTVHEPYPGWTEALIRLCKSHHFDIDHLKTDAFSPRMVGSPATVLHLRYCACLLRVADVLDFDPERTPPILFAHRDVSKGSAIFWHKDHEISFVQKKGHISLHAEPPDALTHHAIELTIRDVDNELLLSRRLADETHFQRMANQDEDLPHRWLLDTNVRPTIKARNDAYEYIDGTFKPDPGRILALLGGVELYGSRLATVREVLQNAFDAVREQIARELLSRVDNWTPEVRDQFARVHSVSLILERDGDSMKLICRDTGTGMSRAGIRSRFLIGGSSANHEIRKLERTCAERGFSLGRTAKFGIGVLSYFLLGSNLTLRTRQSAETGDADATGWTFTSDGLTDFGELRKDPQAPVGTTVELEIRPDLYDRDPDDFAEELRTYVVDHVRRTPCRFSFSASDFGLGDWTSEPGWISRGDDILDLMLVPLSEDNTTVHIPTPVELRSIEAQEQHRKDKQYWSDVRERARRQLSVDAFEGHLPDGLGTYRLSIGTYDLCCGSSPAYFELSEPVEGQCVIDQLGNRDGAAADGVLVLSWNGMGLSTDSRELNSLVLPKSTVLEIDWETDAAGQLAVHRNSFEPTYVALEAVRFVRDQARRHFGEGGIGHSDSPLAAVNACMIGYAAEAPNDLVWKVPAEVDSGLALEKIEMPVIDPGDLWEFDLQMMRWRSSPVTAVPSLFLASNRYADTVSWHSGLFGPTTVGAVKKNDRAEPVLIWERIEPLPGPKDLPFNLVDFPPEWEKVVCVASRASEGHAAWNGSHPLIRAVDLPAWEWAQETFRSSRDPIPHMEGLLSSQARVAAWILYLLPAAHTELWNGLPDRSTTFLADAWRLVEGLEEVEQAVYLETGSGYLELSVLDSTLWSTLHGEEALHQLPNWFPEPADIWWLDYEDGERQLRKRFSD